MLAIATTTYISIQTEFKHSKISKIVLCVWLSVQSSYIQKFRKLCCVLVCMQRTQMPDLQTFHGIRRKLLDSEIIKNEKREQKSLPLLCKSPGARGVEVHDSMAIAAAITSSTSISLPSSTFFFISSVDYRSIIGAEIRVLW